MGGIRQVQNDFEAWSQKMLSQSSAFQGGFARIYSLYQKYQTERFQTEGGSEGTPWPDITEPYKTYKRSRFGGGPKRGGGTWQSWPGAGNKLMIATGTLAGAVIGPGSPFSSVGMDKHRAIFTKTSMQISVTETGNNAEGKPFNYASIADEERPLMEFSDAHIEEMRKQVIQFLFE